MDNKVFQKYITIRGDYTMVRVVMVGISMARIVTQLDQAFRPLELKMNPLSTDIILVKCKVHIKGMGVRTEDVDECCKLMSAEPSFLQFYGGCDGFASADR